MVGTPVVVVGTPVVVVRTGVVVAEVEPVVVVLPVAGKVVGSGLGWNARSEPCSAWGQARNIGTASYLHWGQLYTELTTEQATNLCLRNGRYQALLERTAMHDCTANQ